MTEAESVPVELKELVGKHVHAWRGITKDTKWYDEKVIVIVLLVIVYTTPIGLYLLWKNLRFSRVAKLGLTAGGILWFFLIWGFRSG